MYIRTSFNLMYQLYTHLRTAHAHAHACTHTVTLGVLPVRFCRFYFMNPLDGNLVTVVRPAQFNKIISANDPETNEDVTLF